MSLIEDINCIRSADEEDRKRAIAHIPGLILNLLEHKDEVVKQVLLVIYNLTTIGQVYENLTLSNRSTVIRHLLRLYIETICDEQQPEQISALVSIVKHSNTSELMIELINVLYQCLSSQLDEDTKKSVRKALNILREKAILSLDPEALLMIYSLPKEVGQRSSESTK